MFYSLLAMGFGLTLRSVKFFNVSYGGAALVGGYIMFLLYREWSIHFAPSLFLSILAAGTYSILSYKFIFNPLLTRKASNFVLLIASFGLLTATAATLGMIFGSQSTIIARRLSDIKNFNIFGASLNEVQVFNILSALVIIFLIAYLRSRTRFGRSVRALEDDAEVAELVGISRHATLLKIFFLSGSLAGLGGIILGIDVGIVPSAGLVYILPVIVVSIVGGIRSFWGGILGAFILAIAQKITVVFLGGSWEQAVPFIILIIILLIRPEGILKR